MNISITQETPWTRCHHISHPALHSAVLHVDCLCVWYWPNKCVWRMCVCVGSDPLLHTGGCDVHGGRGCTLVSEADHRLWPNNRQVLHCCITYMLVWVLVYHLHIILVLGIWFSLKCWCQDVESMKCADDWPQIHFPPPLRPVVPIIPVVIPMAVDLSDAVSRDLLVRRPPEENGRGL